MEKVHALCKTIFHGMGHGAWGQGIPRAHCWHCCHKLLMPTVTQCLRDGVKSAAFAEHPLPGPAACLQGLLAYPMVRFQKPTLRCSIPKWLEFMLEEKMQEPMLAKCIDRICSAGLSWALAASSPCPLR